MTKLTKLFAVAASSCLLLPTDAFAQSSDESFVMDEIIVTGRKREETLTDIPVSTTVLGSALIEDAGIDDLNDLFTLVPGLHYDEDGDRLAALPSIRGVQSNEISSNRTKVTAFVDGIPVLGSQGSIGFNSFQQVEVYRGPQSAAFGRSTFAGAINYITKDPTEELEGSIDIDVSDFGERVISGSFSGQIIEDVLGFIIQAEHEDSTSPDEYHADGELTEFTVPGTNRNVSDGTEFNARTGDNISAKFVFTPNDSLSFDLSYSHVETHDQANATFYLTDEAREACFDGVGVYYEGEGGGMSGIYNTGVYDCDWDQTRPNFVQHDHLGYLNDNPLLRDSIIQTAIDAGATTGTFGGRELTVAEQVDLVAQGYSVPDGDIGTQSERDRVTLQGDWVFGNNHAIQLSLMGSEESQLRMTANSILYYDPDNLEIYDDGVTSNMAPGVGITWEPTNVNDVLSTEDDPNTPAVDETNIVQGEWLWLNGMGAAMTIQASPVEIEEQYAELRYVSPGEYRVRGVAGVSYYNYDYLEENYTNQVGMNPPGLGYGAELFGIVPEFIELVGLPFEPDDSILSEEATNTAAFFNVSYDATDWMTLSAEVRYQEDEITGSGIIESADGTKNDRTIKTDSWLPRLAVNFNISDDSSLYLQWSKGVNPAGVNIDLLDPDVVASIDTGIPNAFIPYAGEGDPNNVDVINNDTGLDQPNGDGLVDIYDDSGTDPNVSPYTGLSGPTYFAGLGAESFLTFGEEELNNYEFGFKGSLFEGDLQYAGAIYYIDWQDQIQTANVSWDSPCANDQDAGVPIGFNELEPCVFEGAEYFWIPDNREATANNVAINFGDVVIKGIELEGTYTVNNNISVRGSAAYSQSEYQDYCDVELGLTGLINSSDGAFAEQFDIELGDTGDEITSLCYDTSGNEVADQPRLTWSISPQFRRDVFNGLRFSARADVRYEGRQWLTSGNFAQMPSVMTGNLSLGLSGDRWAVTAYVENFTDEDSPTRISDGGDNTDSIVGLGVGPSTAYTDFSGAEDVNIVRSNYLITPRRPRTLGLRASYDF